MRRHETLKIFLSYLYPLSEHKNRLSGLGAVTFVTVLFNTEDE